MKTVKQRLLELKIKNLEVDGKPIPKKYKSVFNNYLEQIADLFDEYEENIITIIMNGIEEKGTFDTNRDDGTYNLEINQSDLEDVFKLIIDNEKPAKVNKFRNYSGFDLFKDLTKVCMSCGCTPEICNIFGYKEKYQIACMNCTCPNFNVVSDDNFYKVIDKWNNLVKE